ncbi:Fur-regulated basic protein FbpA [Neobacillus sp. WH10]|uniref:Fur-regulated basic protein FbpA n=1 Tax=Neobacillus sp. WH10 TaxID=3047873 RepID=UPI0024C20725|nr:Fur-regulated basic protein FbpA [Neobacillus sp. WH10]WHY79811.1 Fur-regulated basic protein FbpA [Neobacillus sp. WH10]
MNQIQQNELQQKRHLLIDELIKSGIYKINNKHLYEWTLSELEEEFKDIEKQLEGEEQTPISLDSFLNT